MPRDIWSSVDDWNWVVFLNLALVRLAGGKSVSVVDMAILLHWHTVVLRRVEIIVRTGSVKWLRGGVDIVWNLDGLRPWHP